MDKKIIKRDLFNPLKAHLQHKEMTLVVGPRQAGKTTLLRLLEKECKAAGGKTLFLNLDIDQDRQFFSTQQMLVDHIQLSVGRDGGFIFIDEAQRREDAGRFFKGLYDMDLPYKFILSGSGSLELKEKIHESMMGRKRLFELLPVSFREFAAIRTADQYGDELWAALRADSLLPASLLDEYMRFRGYPQVVVTAEASEKLHILNEIYQSYLVRDISFLLGVEKTDAFTNLTRILGSQIGKLAAVSELASTLDISVPTVRQYIWYLEQTFIVQRVPPYFSNTRSEITKMPTFYFYDLGLRNFVLHQSADAAFVDGFLFQNLVFLLLREQFGSLSHPIRFWRSKSGAEVDFVEEKGTRLIPIEVKHASFREPVIGKSLRSFISRYQPEQAYIITREYAHSLKVDSTTIHFLPFYELYELRF